MSSRTLDSSGITLSPSSDRSAESTAESTAESAAERMEARRAVFLAGETIDLCAPLREDVLESGWWQWMNDPEYTRCLVDQGMYPNSPEGQYEYLEQVRRDPTRLVMLLRPKGEVRAVGVTSLSGINRVHRTAHAAILRTNRNRKRRLDVLEVCALLLEHSFERLGMRSLVMFTAYPDLKGMQRRMELFGWRFDGIVRRMWSRGYHEVDAAVGTVLLEDYLRIKELRGGRFWPGEARMRELVAAQPKTGSTEELAARIKAWQDEYYASLQYA